MFCPHCGVQNADDAGKCGSCGTILPQLLPSTPGVAVDTAPDDRAAQARAVLHRRCASGGGWFYWIAGLSILNTMIVLFHGKMSFVTGLGITQFIDGMMSAYGSRSVLILLPINLVLSGMYVLFGYFACRRAVWAFVVGMVCYSLDTILLLLVKAVPELLFHAFALFCIFNGLKALLAAKRLEPRQAEPLVRR